MSDGLAVDQLMADAARPDPARAPSRLKSRIYSSLILRQAESGPLRSLTATKAEGRTLCVFEELVQISPFGESVKMRNPCRICHARLLGEHVEGAPIYWPHCPYVLFQKR
jgi:hypothetical protein